MTAEKDIKKMKCDCLNYCGDDPWIEKRKAEPCDRYKRRKLEEAAQAGEAAAQKELLDRMYQEFDAERTICGYVGERELFIRYMKKSAVLLKEK